jgi:hypothetical protein
MTGLEIRRKFNITGSCNPDRHYMVNVDAKIEAIVQDYIMQGEYFTINRAWQYGKTIMLAEGIFNGRCGVVKMFDTGVLDLNHESDFELMEAIAETLPHQKSKLKIDKWACSRVCQSSH